MKNSKTWLDAGGLPIRAGVYLCEMDGEEREVDVYRHPIKELCCFFEDFGSDGTEGVDDNTDCHVSVQFTGIIFRHRLRNFSYFGHLQDAGMPLPSHAERKKIRATYKEIRRVM